jgi:hypothetical protein
MPKIWPIKADSRNVGDHIHIHVAAWLNRSTLLHHFLQVNFCNYCNLSFQINGNPTAKEKVTLTCSGSTGKWQYLPAVVVPGRWEKLKWIEPETESGSGNSDPDVTDVHCLFT